MRQAFIAISLFFFKMLTMLQIVILNGEIFEYMFFCPKTVSNNSTFNKGNCEAYTRMFRKMFCRKPELEYCNILRMFIEEPF